MSKYTSDKLPPLVLGNDMQIPMTHRYNGGEITTGVYEMEHTIVERVVPESSKHILDLVSDGKTEELRHLRDFCHDHCKPIMMGRARLEDYLDRVLGDL